MNPILVTGGAKGIGAVICLTLAEQGHDIVVHFNTSESHAEKIVQDCKNKGVQAEKIQGNFSNDKGIERFIETYLKRFGKTKGLVNNVGNYLLASLMDTKKEEWLSLMQTNLFAAIFLSQALVPQICLSEGSIVNVGVSGLQRAKVGSAAYHITKMGLWGYTLCLAKELVGKNVSVNMVSPGFTESSVDLKPSADLPMKRPAAHKEIAKLVAFLFEKESHYITGQNIEVAGGVGL